MQYDVEQSVDTSRYQGCTDSVKEDGITGSAYFPIFCVLIGDILSGVSKRRCLVSEWFVLVWNAVDKGESMSEHTSYEWKNE